ncbi:NAD-dependent epimerase/dehydratase family protein [Methylobacterium oxalidis]|uniref:UDP-N-acetylglucosamine 4-epimerase n=1 Tax=Methylobacterium oxalidis TaxID=944322 RepID=A0A512IYC1_9HYPH|nr:NAD-dependent epimerase/dehydratase family protein [Methylobacterium oxalidis]GEP02700.1 UDP-N-acetylglucosamine 4-epimerase [Methylobacterium oxalidis]GJE33594.1 UDP-N-acetylglucosamine 4-epimerase [Methylobacterium oxalidis]GLS66902.1 UDP-N-acetylglucosamine 4-epimerase [Methylobacterium oxalidis]
MSTILVTGAAGFIGFHVAMRLSARGERVLGVDDFNDYYEQELKIARAGRLSRDAHVDIRRVDVANPSAIRDLMAVEDVDRVIHLAAQAGVRYSLDHPFAYERSNMAGHLSVLEACRHTPKLNHLVYASSSSVYGDRPSSGQAFKETDPVDHPISLYAASKRAGELMSDTYSHLFNIPQTGLRFFTVYGPWGRPDMAYFSFTRKALRGEPVAIFGEGRLQRDFTYIDDIVDGIVGVLDRPPLNGGHRILNIGNNQPRSLSDFVSIIEAACGRPLKKSILQMQPGDVSCTWADVSAINGLTGYTPKTSLEVGISEFVSWFRSRYTDDGEVRAN